VTATYGAAGRLGIGGTVIAIRPGSSSAVEGKSLSCMLDCLILQSFSCKNSNDAAVDFVSRKTASRWPVVPESRGLLSWNGKKRSVARGTGAGQADAGSSVASQARRRFGSWPISRSAQVAHREHPAARWLGTGVRPTRYEVLLVRNGSGIVEIQASKEAGRGGAQTGRGPGVSGRDEPGPLGDRVLPRQ
jgi:hypothetical protein